MPHPVPTCANELGKRLIVLIPQSRLQIVNNPGFFYILYCVGTLVDEEDDDVYLCSISHRFNIFEGALQYCCEDRCATIQPCEFFSSVESNPPQNGKDKMWRNS